MKSTIKIQNETYTIGKNISFNNVVGKYHNCRGCKAKFNAMVKYGLSPDNIKWDCHNCDSNFNIYYIDIESEEKTDLIIRVRFEKHGNIIHKEFVLLDNTNFKELVKNG